MIPFHPLRVLWGKTIGRHLQGPVFSYGEVVGGEVFAMTDLGAYRKPLQDLPGIRGVVIMEDRFPEFFLSYEHFKPREDAMRNRHGPLQEYRTHEDIRMLVSALKERGITVLIGFWNYFGWRSVFPRRPRWFRSHPEVRPIPGSSDIDPFFILKREGMSYAASIGFQYKKLKEDFRFDGLFLGDGFAGYRSFTNLSRYRDRAATAPKWQELYRTIATAVHGAGGLLFSYDCMGLSYEEAKLHGADYRLLSDAGLDYLVFQAYPQAWGEYWMAREKERFTLQGLARNFTSVAHALKGTRTRLLYTVELRDRVEGWHGDPVKTKKAIAVFDPIADGRVLVWANDLFSRKA